MGIYLNDQDHDCFTNLRFADDVLLFASSKEQPPKNVVRIQEKVLKKWDSRYMPGKDESSQQPEQHKSGLEKKEVQVGDVNIEILTRSESVRYLGQLITFQHQETIRNQKSYQDSLGDVSQIQARADFKKKKNLLKHRLRLFDAAMTPTIGCASGTWTPSQRA